MQNKNSMQSWQQDSYLTGGSEEYLEGLYELYLKNPEQLTPKWLDYFKQVNPGAHKADISHADIRQLFRDAALSSMGQPQTSSVSHDACGGGVAELIDAHRRYGHRLAKLDPLNMMPIPDSLPQLTLEYHGLTETNSSLLKKMRDIYCQQIGIEFMHITNQAEVDWLIQQIETQPNASSAFSTEEKQAIFHDLVAADTLEKYLGNKYVGQKRFSLEGGDSLIPALNEIIRRASHQGVEECLIGMAHRGRLNVLMNVLGKSSRELFDAFEAKLDDSDNRSGDVKYHLGYAADIKTSSGVIHLALAFNPSHLEIISPVVNGAARAHQDRRKDKKGITVLPITIHGDAAIAGQGVVMETLSFSQTRGFFTGGSIRIVINNQVGFTTSNRADARSTLYCTDIAKMIEAPVFHVNGNDPEAVCQAARIAIDYRMKFHKDVFIDLVCFRRHGHNEADEPSATQPLMYKTIKQMPPVYELYVQQLLKSGEITQEISIQELANYRAALDAGEVLVKTLTVNRKDVHRADWSTYVVHRDLTLETSTTIPKETLIALAQKLEELPAGFVLQSQVAKTMEDRKKMTLGELPLNWGYAENLAYAVLLDRHFSVRLSGEDVGRGTFAHRHAALHDQQTDAVYYPLSSLAQYPARFTCIDALLSEEATMAFEYGYAAADPESLVLWEGQFGDFANGAQVVIDQFLSAGEQKWDRLCGLTLLLPHGYEGMGPEHSSARLERYLQLCAQHNMSVCVPSTPAQMYHLLLRQMIRPVRKPLIVMTPKSLLRHKLAVSSLEDLAQGTFQLVYPDIDDLPLNTVKKIVVCSGKVYYDLLQQRRDKKLNHVAILRVEQLYPFPKECLAKEIGRYKNAKTVIWCQEEPMNQGAWYQSYFYLRSCVVDDGRTLEYVGRPAFASTATGSAKRHAIEQEALVAAALL